VLRMKRISQIRPAGWCKGRIQVLVEVAVKGKVPHRQARSSRYLDFLFQIRGKQDSTTVESVASEETAAGGSARSRCAQGLESPLLIQVSLLLWSSTAGYAPPVRVVPPMPGLIPQSQV
jgi:hypothetical protein